MKKTVILSLILCVAGAAFGQEFTFRGFPWGSTVEDIIAKEGQPDRYSNLDDLRGYCDYYDVEIFSYKADLFFAFRDHKLVRANYQIISSGSSSYDIYNDFLYKLGLLYGMPVKETNTSHIYEYYWVVAKSQITLRLAISRDHKARIAIVYESPEINGYGDL